MKVLLDTNILIDYLNGVPDAKDEIEACAAPMISLISYMEVLVGAKTPNEEAVIRQFLCQFRSLAITDAIAEQAIHLRKTHHLKLPDAIIYATAKTEGCLFVTRNTKDFPHRLPDIRIPYSLA